MTKRWQGRSPQTTGKTRRGSSEAPRKGQHVRAIHRNRSVGWELLRIKDKCTDGAQDVHGYTVTVEFEWNAHTQEFESPDPVIVNDPGAKVSFLKNVKPER